MTRSTVQAIRAAVTAGLRGQRRVVLAVSGGIDSMVLLDAVAAAIPSDRLTVATFDHQSGPHSTRAVQMVAREATARGIAVVIGRGERVEAPTEATWRAARWRFLNDVGAATGGGIATAHTRDDQVETVLLRALRGAGTRGLAGLHADSAIRRPLLSCGRAEIEEYAARRQLRWVNDPSNQSRAFARNRARLEILPALRRVRPNIDSDLLELSATAARWRARVEELTNLTVAHLALPSGNGLDVSAASLASFGSESLAVVWPVLAARTGATLDWRGTRRLAEFTIKGRVGSRIQLSGGWVVHRSHELFELRRAPPPIPSVVPMAWGESVVWHQWRFHPAGTADTWNDDDPWSAWLPADRPLEIRSWLAGDRMALEPGGPERRVKRYLSDVGIAGHDRSLWPVVLAGGEIVWIPGVRRTRGLRGATGASSAVVTAQTPRSGLVYHCDYQRA